MYGSIIKGRKLEQMMWLMERSVGVQEKSGRDCGSCP